MKNTILTTAEEMNSLICESPSCVIVEELHPFKDSGFSFTACTIMHVCYMY